MSDEQPKPPHRSYEVTIRISGDGWPAVLRRLADIADHIPEHGPECGEVSGGYDSGSYVEIKHDPEQTHDKWAAELDAWLKQRKRATPDTRGGGA